MNDTNELGRLLDVQRKSLTQARPVTLVIRKDRV